MKHAKGTRHDLERLLGPVSDHLALQVLKLEPSLAQLEEVSLWLAEEDDVLAEARLPLAGVAAQILELLERDEEVPDESRGEAPQ